MATAAKQAKAKPAKCMRDKAKDKMQEPSTWNGLSVIAAIG